MNELTIAKKVSFGALTIDCYMDRDGNAYVTREAIGRALEYPHPRQSIDAIHRRHKKRLDRFSTVVILTTVDGKTVKWFFTLRAAFMRYAATATNRKPMLSMMQSMKYWRACGWAGWN